MSNDEGSSFVVDDYDKFIDGIRKTIYGGFGKEVENDEELMFLIEELQENEQDMEDLDRSLSMEEAKTISKEYIKKQKNKNTGETRYVVTEGSFEGLIMALNDRLVSNLLSALVAKGLIETAYDSDENDFIFWVTDEVQEQIREKNNDE